MSNFEAHGVIILVTVFISSSEHLDVLNFVVALESGHIAEPSSLFNLSARSPLDELQKTEER